MVRKKMIILLLIAIILISGCSNKASDGGETTGPTDEPATSVIDGESPGSDAELESAKYEFNPHLYVPMLAADIPQDYWDSFYNLCDALRAGEITFECSSEEAYRWATNPATLNQLFPAACTKIKGESNDGSTPFENGIGRIYYQMPIDEYVERQGQFEETVASVLNMYLEPDDDEFEKCLKLYDYMSTCYSYEYDFVENKHDGAGYLTIMNGTGQCIDLAGVYAYFLLQAGVEAMEVGGHAPDMEHAWVYLVIDGNGYYSDSTWGLRLAGEDLDLYYFLMSGERRAETGFDLDDLTAPLLPRYWAQFSSVEFTAANDKYCFPSGSFFHSIDEDNKIIRYRCNGEEQEFKYD